MISSHETEGQSLSSLLVNLYASIMSGESEPSEKTPLLSGSGGSTSPKEKVPDVSYKSG